MIKKLCISLIFSNLVAPKLLNINHRMHNLYTKFVKILEICKEFSENLVNEHGNIPRRGQVPKFSDLEVVALTLTAESESIDSENWLFEYKLQEYKDKIPNLISRRQFNDRRDFGFCASQNTYYFGYKLHAVCGLSGVIHSYDLSKASVHDLKFANDIKNAYKNCNFYSDRGYIGADVQLDLFETAHIKLECPYRLNQKNWKPTFIPFAKARKRIETLFGSPA